MSEVHRFSVVKMLSEAGNKISYEPHGPEIVMAKDYDALAAEAQALREEVAALRARVVVVPERKLLNAGVPGLNRNSGWNACLDELARINGMTVSEGLLRRLARPADRYDEVFTLDRHEAAEELRALLSEQEGGKQ
ncbi:hypothetical protein NRQ82_006494 [Pseudomonas aeruginosa]|uniref:hypothetical protein n=1 Tax=Pseudomonas aeruginosa TaxID=287 RepID=UPI0025A803F6|nr:hypothetical protein [Pseudomonas aeruginosa]ELQ7934708.1 hypothetical protein [Pseudomonas aeruginosa]